MKSKKTENALKINKGIPPPSAVNPALKNKLKTHFKKEKPGLDELLDGIKKSNRTLISRAITLIESELPEDKETASELLKKCLPSSGNSFRLGITGVPGAGKSTFIETFGLYAIEQGKKVAVLAIDPSSTKTKGSILGDKTRMEQLSAHPLAFIRPSPTAGSLGGVAKKTRESIIILEAAGYDFIIVETVGVGQSEITVAQMTDFFLLMLIAGAGDELQGIKRGVMEMADLVLINKSDGDNVQKALLTKKEIENALHLFPVGKSQWKPQVIAVSALEKKGIDETWRTIDRYLSITRQNGYFYRKREEQLISTLKDHINNRLLQTFYQNPFIQNQLSSYEELIKQGKISPYEAAEKLLKSYFENL